MKTGIEKFKNVIDSDTCDLLIKHLEDNLHHSMDLTHTDRQNVICKEITLEPHTEIDNVVYKVIAKVSELYKEKYPFFQVRGDTGYQLRKITGNTREHIDNLSLIHI